MLIDKIYQKLCEECVCENGYDFSVRFLGKSRSYFSVIKSRKIEPSMDAVCTLEIALKNEADNYDSNLAFISDIRTSLLKLSTQVKNYRENRSRNMILHNGHWL